MALRDKTNVFTPVDEAVQNSDYGTRAVIKILAVDVRKTENHNEWELHIPAFELSGEDDKMLRRLFPNTLNTVLRQLDIETLIRSVADARR